MQIIVFYILNNSCQFKNTFCFYAVRTITRFFHVKHVNIIFLYKILLNDSCCLRFTASSINNQTFYISCGMLTFFFLCNIKHSISVIVYIGALSLITAIYRCLNMIRCVKKIWMFQKTLSKYKAVRSHLYLVQSTVNFSPHLEFKVR